MTGSTFRFKHDEDAFLQFRHMFFDCTAKLETAFSGCQTPDEAEDTAVACREMFADLIDQAVAAERGCKVPCDGAMSAIKAYAGIADIYVGIAKADCMERLIQ